MSLYFVSLQTDQQNVSVREYCVHFPDADCFVFGFFFYSCFRTHILQRGHKVSGARGKCSTGEDRKQVKTESDVQNEPVYTITHLSLTARNYSHETFGWSGATHPHQHLAWRREQMINSLLQCKVNPVIG